MALLRHMTWLLREEYGMIPLHSVFKLAHVLLRTSLAPQLASQCLCLSPSSSSKTPLLESGSDPNATAFLTSMVAILKLQGFTLPALLLQETNSFCHLYFKLSLEEVTESSDSLLTLNNEG